MAAPTTLILANKYIKGINERRNVASIGTLATEAANNNWEGQAGHKVTSPGLDWKITTGNSRWNWWEIQRWIELLAPYFVEPTSYDGIATIPNMTATWTENATPSGNNNDTFGGTFWSYFNSIHDYTGWRAKRDGDASYSYRRCRNTTGNPDVGQGEWIYEDLDRALKILVHMKKTFAWSSNGGSVTKNTSQGFDPDYPDRQDAIDLAVANFATPTTSTDVNPVQVTSEIVGSLGWWANIGRRQCWGSLSGMYASLNRDVDWYAFVENWYTFNAQGDGVVEDRFKLGMTDAGKTGATLTSTDKFLSGRFSVGTGMEWGVSGDAWHGYQAGVDAADRVAVIKWNVAGGFTYQ